MQLGSLLESFLFSTTDKLYLSKLFYLRAEYIRLTLHSYMPMTDANSMQMQCSRVLNMRCLEATVECRVMTRARVFVNNRFSLMYL